MRLWQGMAAPGGRFEKDEIYEGALEAVLRDALVVRAAIFWFGFVVFLSLELLVPYRPGTVSKLRRVAINLAIALLNSVIVNVLFRAATERTALYAGEGHWGLLNMFALPFWSRLFATIVAMDFILYIWHLLNHEMPLLWRFHQVHHSDLNMDVSTASRFHAGEIIMSSVVRIALVYFLGAEITGVIIFESLLVFSAQFQHSSVKVPAVFGRIYWLLFVPPAMHRIHHSVVIRERNANYGTIFSFWDRMFGTLLKEVDQENIVIGLGAYRDPKALHINHLLLMPFGRPAR
jgi:sterol desaturase/sphingolipid hydroxylase (fatty acid hydroxylase superfamily)